MCTQSYNLTSQLFELDFGPSGLRYQFQWSKNGSFWWLKYKCFLEVTCLETSHAFNCSRCYWEVISPQSYYYLLTTIYVNYVGICVVFLQWAFLLLCVASIWIHNHIISAYLPMVGVATSRLGLWMFDLSVTQQMQVKKTSAEPLYDLWAQHLHLLKGQPDLAFLRYIKMSFLPFLKIQVFFCLWFFLSFPTFWTGWCSWIWSLCRGRRSKLAPVLFRFDGLCHGNNYIESTGDYSYHLLCCFSTSTDTNPCPHFLDSWNCPSKYVLF